MKLDIYPLVGVTSTCTQCEKSFQGIPNVCDRCKSVKFLFEYEGHMFTNLLEFHDWAVDKEKNAIKCDWCAAKKPKEGEWIISGEVRYCSKECGFKSYDAVVSGDFDYEQIRHDAKKGNERKEFARELLDQIKTGKTSSYFFEKLYKELAQKPQCLPALEFFPECLISILERCAIGFESYANPLDATVASYLWDMTNSHDHYYDHSRDYDEEY